MEPWQLGPPTRTCIPWPPTFPTYSYLKAGLEQAIEEHPPFGEWLVPTLIVEFYDPNSQSNLLKDPTGYSANRMFEMATAAAPSDVENYQDVTRSIENLKRAYIKEMSEKRFRTHLRRLRLEHTLEEHRNCTPETQRFVQDVLRRHVTATEV